VCVPGGGRIQPAARARRGAARGQCARVVSARGGGGDGAGGGERRPGEPEPGVPRAASRRRRARLRRGDARAAARRRARDHGDEPQQRVRGQAVQGESTSFVSTVVACGPLHLLRMRRRAGLVHMLQARPSTQSTPTAPWEVSQKIKACLQPGVHSAQPPTPPSPSPAAPSSVTIIWSPSHTKFRGHLFPCICDVVHSSRYKRKETPERLILTLTLTQSFSCASRHRTSSLSRRSRPRSRIWTTI
jgi:hypothetical protein